MLARLRQDPGLVLRLPKLALQSQIGDVSLVQTDHPRLWVLMRAIGRFPRLRSLGLRVSHPPDELPTARATSEFEGVDADRVLGELRREGVAPGLDLPRQTVGELLDFATGGRFYLYPQRDLVTTLAELEAYKREHGIEPTMGEYLDLGTCDAIDRLAHDPLLLRIARDYLGNTPRHIANRLWWSWPSNPDERAKSTAAQLFHFDLDDFRFVKFFFYLTDVDETAGPHVVVKGTHRRRRPFHSALIRRFSDAEVERAYGRERVVPMCLAAGSGFAEDTFCIHKGQTPAATPRLLLQLEYGLNDFRAGE